MFHKKEVLMVKNDDIPFQSSAGKKGKPPGRRLFEKKYFARKTNFVL